MGADGRVCLRTRAGGSTRIAPTPCRADQKNQQLCAATRERRLCHDRQTGAPSHYPWTPTGGRMTPRATRRRQARHRRSFEELCSLGPSSANEERLKSTRGSPCGAASLAWVSIPPSLHLIRLEICINCGVTVQMPVPAPLTNINSWQPQGVRSRLLYHHLNLLRVVSD